MATDSTNRFLRQSHLFLALLILLWGLILCFVGYQYSREKEQTVGLLSSRLQLLNLQLGDDIANDITPEGFFGHNTLRFDNLRLSLLDYSGEVIYDSNEDYRAEAKMEIINEIFSSSDGTIIKNSHIAGREDIEFIHTAVRSRDYIIYSSASYSISFLDVFRGSNTFLIIAIVISLLITAVGFITSRLYYDLDLTTKERDSEHETALREEQDKIRLKRQLTNNISHELKTPICSIMGYLEMILSNDKLDAATAHSFVAKSYDQAERLRHLMSDLSTITRIDEASDMVEREVLDLSALIEGIKEDVRPQLEEQGITIISNIDKQLFIEGNNSLLYSIFRNLVDNAIAYSGARHIWIDLVREESERFYFSLRDNGIGIDEKHLPYIFERFYRVDKGRSRKMGGTGLGLSIVKNAVLFHSGTIEARCDDMGGVEFLFSLGGKCTTDDTIYCD